MTFIAKKHISRRALLRGAGVTLALPLLDAMLPAQTIAARFDSDLPQPIALIWSSPLLRATFCASVTSTNGGR